MQQADMDMLVDHYPLRNAVETFDSKFGGSLQSARLLSEAMAGSELLVAVTPTEDQTFIPLTFSVGGKRYLVAGTSAEYAKSDFINYLADRIVKKDIRLRSIDSRDLIVFGMTMKSIDAILIDMETDEDEDSLIEGLARCSLYIDGLTSKSVTSPSELLEAEEGQKFDTLPRLVLSMLAREESESERKSILFDYLSRCTKAELQSTIVFIGTNEHGSDATFTTLARGFVARLIWYNNLMVDVPVKEHSISLINLWTWLTALVEQPRSVLHLDSTLIDDDFARKVIAAVESR